MSLQDRISKIATRQEALEVLRDCAQTVPSGLKFKVDRFKPEDAWGVVQCCYSIYGSGYPVDTYYIPMQLIEQTRNGNIHGVVARTDGGDVIGFGALFRSTSPNCKVYEGGQYIVRKEYRNSNAAFEIDQIIQHRLPGEVGLDALYGEVVCSHKIVQKMGVRDGAIETGIELDLMPAEAYETETGQAGRVAALLMFRVLKDRPHEIFLPEFYMEIVGGCVHDLGLSRSFKGVGKGYKGGGETRFAQQYFEEAAVARLTLTDTGMDFDLIFGDFESTASRKGCKVRQVFLNIGDPATGDAFLTLLSNGYFFGGYLPLWFETDGMLLQKLTGPPDLESIHLYSDRAKALLEFTLKDRERALG
jgi:hypothetical protein